MNSSHKTVSWVFFVVWTVVTLLGVMVGFLVFFIAASALGEASGTISKISEPLALLVFVIVFGLVTGIAQGSILKRFKPGIAVWIGATLLGFLISSAAVLAWGGGFGPAILTSSSLMMATTIGLVLGIMQWLFLRRKAGLSPWWIGISLLGWVLADVIAILLMHQSYQMGPIYYWLGLIFFGIAMTGIGMVLLFKQR